MNFKREITGDGSEEGEYPTRMEVKMARRLMAICAAMLAISGAAFAHATLKQSSPDAGSTVAGFSAGKITLTLSDNVEPAFSRIEVTNTGGARVDEGKLAASGNTRWASNRFHLVAIACTGARCRWTLTRPRGALRST